MRDGLSGKHFEILMLLSKYIHLQKLELVKSTLLIFRITCRWMEWVITSGYWPNALHNGWMTLNAPLSWQKCVMLNWLQDYEDFFCRRKVVWLSDFKWRAGTDEMVGYFF